MSLSTSSKILNFAGIIALIFGIFGIAAGLLSFAGSSILGIDLMTGGETATNVKDTAFAMSGLIVLGLIVFIHGILSLLEGIFSIRASKNHNSIMPAWVFAVLGVITSFINTITAFQQTITKTIPVEQNPATYVISSLITLVISLLIFMAANTIKRHVGK